MYCSTIFFRKLPFLKKHPLARTQNFKTPLSEKKSSRKGGGICVWGPILVNGSVIMKGCAAEIYVLLKSKNANYTKIRGLHARCSRLPFFGKRMVNGRGRIGVKMVGGASRGARAAFGVYGRGNLREGPLLFWAGGGIFARDREDPAPTVGAYAAIPRRG